MLRSNDSVSPQARRALLCAWLTGALLAPTASALGTFPTDPTAMIPAVTGGSGHRSVQLGWERSTPRAEGLDAARLDRFVREVDAGRYGWVDRVVVVRNGRLVVDFSRDNDYAEISRGQRSAIGCGVDACEGPEELHQFNYLHPDFHPWWQGRGVHSLQSVTKSVAATLIGVAIERGEIPGVEVPLLSWFEGYDLDGVDPRLHDATLEDLLTMRSGIEWHEQDRPFGPTNTTIQLEGADDWIQFTLDQPMDAAPGTRWAYNSGGSHLMSGVIRAATGEFIDTYAEEHLFGPLGITDYHWKKTPRGYPDTEGGLYLESLDLAKIGQLYLQDGVWEERRILPEGWARAVTARHVEDVNSRGFDYGYQWWRIDDRGTEIWAGLGFGEQYLLVLPEHDLVGVVNSWNLFGGRRAPLLNGFRDALLDALEGAPADAADLRGRGRDTEIPRPRAAEAPDAIVWLVRHAETERPPYAGDPPDPFLNEVGLARADALANLLAGERIDRIYSTETRRTQATARPVAHRARRVVASYDPRDLGTFAARLRATGGRILVVGHSNTTPALVEALGGDPGEPIDESTEFDRLYRLTIEEGTVRTDVSRYGEPLPQRLRDAGADPMVEPARRADDGPPVPGAPTRAAALIASSHGFELHSAFWYNLHDFLFWHAEEADAVSVDGPCLQAIDASDRAAWASAVAFYDDEMAGRNYRRDPLMRELRFFFAGLADGPPGSEAESVLEHLHAAAPAYQLCRWRRDDDRNRAWADDLTALLDEHGAAISARLADLYRDTWPRPFPVDVVGYGSWAGANTTGRPLHMTISSHDPDTLGPRGLELLHHEASHGVYGSGWGTVSEALDVAFSRRGIDADRDLWHALMFFISGHVVEEVLEAAGTGDYVPHMVRNGVYEELHPPLERSFGPYLAGEIDLEAAAEALAGEFEETRR